MIEGRMVNLRAASLDDLERNTRWLNDRDTARLARATAYPVPLPAQEAWLRARAEQPMSYDRAFFAIDTKAGEHIGNTDIFGASPEDRWGWLGITIGEPAYRSRGYGSDALRTLLDFAFGEMNLVLVRLQVWSFNERAIACYRKNGFVEEARLRDDLYVSGRRHANIVMSTTREEFTRLVEESAA